MIRVPTYIPSVDKILGGGIPIGVNDITYHRARCRRTRIPLHILGKLLQGG